MASFDLDQLGRLDAEYKKQLQQCLQTKKRYEKLNADYEALSTRLYTLSDKVSHDVMVPFGSLALMPGKIVHTNEITVHLGGGWFVERSTKQALEIVKRRIIMYSNTLKKLEKEEEHILKWIKYSNNVKGDENLIEIQEEYDQEKEELWRQAHKENVRRYKQAMKYNSAKELPDDTQENENDESKTSIKLTTKPMSISFTHSSINNEKILETKTESTFPIIQSPEDIYKLFGSIMSPETTKSILKRRNHRNQTESKPNKNHVRFVDEELAKSERDYTLAELREPLAFSGTIVEKYFTETFVEDKEKNQTIKPISKFKAQRQTGQFELNMETITEIIEDKSNIRYLKPLNSVDEIKTESKPAGNQPKPKTAFSTILERSSIEPMKPSEFKDTSKKLI